MLRKEHWPASVQEFERKWTRYKRGLGLQDFCDLIEICLHDFDAAPGRPSVIVADEAQDLNPMQLELIRHWGKRTNYFVFATDDDQTIYVFTGASPNAILSPEIPDDHKIVLKTSHRLPRKVQRFANALIHQVARLVRLSLLVR